MSGSYPAPSASRGPPGARELLEHLGKLERDTITALVRLWQQGESDDASIGSDAKLCRAVRPIHLVPPNQFIPGQEYSTAALKNSEVSVYLIDEWSIEEMQQEFQGARLTAFLAKHARSVEFVIVRVPDDKGNPAHAVLVRRDEPGQIASRGNLVKLRQESEWIDATG